MDEQIAHIFTLQYGVDQRTYIHENHFLRYRNVFKLKTSKNTETILNRIETSENLPWYALSNCQWPCRSMETTEGRRL